VTCKSGAPTLDGSRSLSIKENISATFVRPTSVSMFLETKTKKVKLLKLTKDIMEPTKDGKYFILTKRQRLRPRDSMKNSDSTSTDHSTLSLSFHSIELLKALVPTMSLSRDGERMLKPNNSGLMRSQRQLETITGRTTVSRSRAMATAAI
jgi:hypothetical protein